MSQKKVASPKDKLPMELTLSTGYKVKFDLGNVQDGLKHLARALFGEVFLARARQTAKKSKKPSWDPSIRAIHGEIASIVIGMSDGAKSGLLHAIIWDIYTREAGKIGDKVNKANTKQK